MSARVLIAGGGIGGLAAALACTRAGCEVLVLERAAQFESIGAGVQLGPNVTRILQRWGMQSALQEHAAFVPQLQVKNAVTGAVLATLPLGQRAQARYGAPYVTVHRADLHAMLAAAAQAAGATVQPGYTVAGFAPDAARVHVQTQNGEALTADALIGADGLNSRIRTQLLADGAPQPTGHLAFRALVAQDALPQSLRSTQITVWLGPRLHVVQYPVRGGAALNIVAFVHGQALATSDWDNATTAEQLLTAMAGTTTALQNVLRAVTASTAGWRLWVMYDRPPLTSAAQMARGNVALLGDAAHPMRPYLAQGAGMAIEDADALEIALKQSPSDMPAALAHYARMRWQRNARVQARARRNGQIFHATGFMLVGRDLSLRMLGARLLDMPWLYKFEN
ncbi:MAG: FAD-dependent monooxygenase [Burkholderiaceae bacterium]